MSNIRKIAVIGATGMLGKPVTKQLAAAGFEVTALVRNPEKAARELPPSVKRVPADLKDLQSLKKALAGQDALYLNLSVEQTEKQSDFHPEGEGLRNALVAARENGLGRVSYLSSIVIRYPTDWWVFALKRRAVEDIKGSGLPYTLFYPTQFMETIDGRTMAGNRLLVVGQAQHPNWWIAAEDYGRQVANDFRNDHPGNREYVVQGPEPILTGDAAERFAKAYRKKPVGVARLPMGPFKLLRPLTPRFRYGYEIINALNRYPETFEAQQTWDDLGKPVITLENYARGL
ncbi:MAG: putative NADH-ubiquinone oxidoreductase [uncultured Cytophagales bacterium]|uniref:Putative NADH-ubiquinone oxidoreductase n=1 Tax=uncultured Cytophagales bacterium TaxID=158755 RepID=A0A6J4KEU4_9SPHI|nr:MAG: putative NADH-ubiquinone oxidoreductase [uncultured Cytophagales bacterium]